MLPHFLFITIPPSHSFVDSIYCFSTTTPHICPNACASFSLPLIVCLLFYCMQPSSVITIPHISICLHLYSSPTGTGSDDFFAAGGSGGRSSAAAYVTASLSHASATLSLQGTPIASLVSDALLYIVSHILYIFSLIDRPPSFVVMAPYYPSFLPSFLTSLPPHCSLLIASIVL